MLACSQRMILSPEETPLTPRGLILVLGSYPTLLFDDSSAGLKTLPRRRPEVVADVNKLDYFIGVFLEAFVSSLAGKLPVRTRPLPA